MARGNGLASLVGLLVGGAFGRQGAIADRRERDRTRQERADQLRKENDRADTELAIRQRAQQADAIRSIGATMGPDGQAKAAAAAARILTGEAVPGAVDAPAVEPTFSTQPGASATGPIQFKPATIGIDGLRQGETFADYSKRIAAEQLLMKERVDRVGDVAKNYPKAYSMPGRSYEGDLQAAVGGGPVSVLAEGADLGPSVTELAQQHARELEQLRQTFQGERDTAKRQAAERLANSRAEMARYKDFASYIGKARQDYFNASGTPEGLEDFEKKQAALWQAIAGGGSAGGSSPSFEPVIPAPLPREVIPPAAAGTSPAPLGSVPAPVPVSEEQDLSYPALVAGRLANPAATSSISGRPAPPSTRSGALTGAESPEVTAYKAREAEQRGIAPAEGSGSSYAAMFPQGTTASRKASQADRKLDQGDRRIAQGDRKLDQGDRRLNQQESIENRRLNLQERDVKARERNIASLVVTRSAQVQNAADRLAKSGDGGKDSKQVGLMVGLLRRNADNARKGFKDALSAAVKDEDTGHLWHGFNPRVESTWPKDPKLRQEAERISNLANAADLAEAKLEDGVNYLTGGQYGKVKEGGSPNNAASGPKTLEISEGAIKGKFSFKSRDSLRDAFKGAGYSAQEAEAKADKYWGRAR